MYREDTNKICNMQISVESLTNINNESMRGGRSGSLMFENLDK